MIKSIKKILIYLLIIFLPGLLTIVSRVFLWDMFLVPSGSMEPTLQKGDHVIVNKTVFGARVYENYDALFADKPKIKRIFRRRELERGDIIIFNYPFAREWGRIAFDFNTLFVKRTVGLPGDSVYAQNGSMRVKGVDLPIGIKEKQEALGRAREDGFAPNMWRVMAPDPIYGQWNIQNFGPIYVPRKGDNIEIDDWNFSFYKHIIAFETGVKPSKNPDGDICLGDTVITRYRFRGNWYFACGDNTLSSMDSRYWGFIPEDFIIGVVTRIAYSWDKRQKKWHWNRMFRNVRLEDGD